MRVTIEEILPTPSARAHIGRQHLKNVRIKPRPLSAPSRGRAVPMVSVQPANPYRDGLRRTQSAARTQRRADGIRASSVGVRRGGSVWSGWRDDGQRPRRRPVSLDRGRLKTGGHTGRGQSRDGGWKRVIEEGKERCGCLQHRLAQAASRSSQLLDDVKRLRRAGGLAASCNLDSISNNTIEDAQNVRRKRAQAIWIDPYSRRIYKSAKGMAKVGDTGAMNAASGDEDSVDIGTIVAQAKRAVVTPEGGQMPVRGNDGCHPHSPQQGLLPPRPHSAPPARTRDDVERLRKVVREAMFLSGQFKIGGSAGRIGASRRDRHDAPQWSQSHEACLGEMRRQLRETGSPLLRAKDPAVLVGALLRRQGPLIRRLDDAVVALTERAEALDALVLVAGGLRNAGISADALFTRAGIISTGKGGIGSTPHGGNGPGGFGGAGVGNNGGTSETRRCTVKKLLLEVNRVLGDEVASARELKIALSACLLGGGPGREGEGDGETARMEWVTVSQLDHALKICSATRRALDPQGASHPPLTGKRAAGFLESMRRSQISDIAAGPRNPFASTSASVATPNGKEKSKACLRASARRSRGGKQEGKKTIKARRRTGRWTEGDRDLAERELAGVIVEREQTFVEGYVRQRRCYLSRRVAAQRDGHGGFQMEKTGFLGSGGPRAEAEAAKEIEARNAEFKEAVKRTKLTLKLLEAKAATSTAAAATAALGPSTFHRAGDAKSRSTIGTAPRVQSTNRDAMSTGAAAAMGPRPLSPPAETKTDASGKNSRTAPRDFKGSTSNVGGNDKHRSGRTTTMLQRLTEEYSDRVGEGGGGAPRCSSRHLQAIASGGGIGGVGGTGPAAERKRAHAAALTVQKAFRVRMFRRFVWAQAYLRRPMHAFRFFLRVSRPILGKPPPLSLNSVSAGVINARGNLASNPAFGGKTVLVGPNGDPVTSIDAWPEAPGFCTSNPRHVHCADNAFWAYSRWHREAMEARMFTIAEAATADDTPKINAGEIASIGPEIPTARTVRAIACKEEDPRTATSSASRHPRKAGDVPSRGEAADTLPAAVHGTVPPPPPGAYLFERKHAVRKEAIRVFLLDLRLPLASGALDEAIEDLEGILHAEATALSEDTVCAGFAFRSTTGPETSGNTRDGSRGRGAGRGRQTVQDSGISFVAFYYWWMRHLPYDPTAASCLVKTVRVARGLHSMEVATGGF